MQYTTHYNLNLPEGTDIVNPLIQDNPNYSAIDTALYNNKLRVIGTATHVKTGTNHSITLTDSDIVAFKFVATGDYATGDTFTVDGVTVTARVADGSTIPNGAFKINSTIEAILDGTILNLINIYGSVDAGDVFYDNTSSGLNASDAQGAIDELNANITGLIKSTTISVTTNANGNAAINLSSPNVVIACTVSQGYKIIPYRFNDDWYITVLDTSGSTVSAVVNQNMNPKIYYI